MICTNCPNVHTAAAAPCSLCGYDTNSCFKLCDACSLKNDECNTCRVKLNLKISEKTITAIDKAISTHSAEVAKVEAAYQQAIHPFKDALKVYEDGMTAANTKLNKAEEQIAPLLEKLRAADKAVKERKATSLDATEEQNVLDAVWIALRKARDPYEKEYSSAINKLDTAFGPHAHANGVAYGNRRKSVLQADRTFDAAITELCRLI